MKNIVNKILEINLPTIYVCATPYNILMALCLILNVQRYKETYIVMPTPVKKNYVYFKKISERLSTLGIKNIVILKSNLQRALRISDIKNIRIRNKILRELKTEKKGFLLINFSWRQQIVGYPSSLYFSCCKKAIFMEEGTTQYITPIEASVYTFLKRIYGNQTKYWEAEKLTAIYEQYPERYPDYLQSKMCSFVFDQCIENVRIHYLGDILNIFATFEEQKELKELMKEEFGVIFTQPFSEAGYMTEKEKIQIITDLVEYYSKYGKVVLKVHPRDTTIYNIEGIQCIKGSYPSELFLFLNIKFKFAIGICTSAVENVNADVKMNLNENFLKELKYELKPL